MSIIFAVDCLFLNKITSIIDLRDVKPNWFSENSFWTCVGFLFLVATYRMVDDMTHLGDGRSNIFLFWHPFDCWLKRSGKLNLKKWKIVYNLGMRKWLSIFLMLKEFPPLVKTSLVSTRNLIAFGFSILGLIL